jgi:hypothetical protein
MTEHFHIVCHHMQRFRPRIRCDYLAALQHVCPQLHEQVFELVAARILLGAQKMGHDVLQVTSQTT